MLWKKSNFYFAFNLIFFYVVLIFCHGPLQASQSITVTYVYD